jgi:hypothetical protein
MMKALAPDAAAAATAPTGAAAEMFSIDTSRQLLSWIAELRVAPTTANRLPLFSSCSHWRMPDTDSKRSARPISDYTTPRWLPWA